MTDENALPALDDEVLALLAEAKEIAPLDASANAALFARVAARIDVPHGGGDGGDGPGGSTGSSSVASGTSAVAGGARVARLAIGLALAVGVGAGVALDRTVLAPGAPSPPVLVASTARPVPSAVPNVPDGLPVSALPSAPPPPAPAPPATARPEASRETAVSARGLGAERALLDVARGALARGEARDALDATDRHAKDYPDGALVEEREAIAIKALVALGSRDEARRRAAAFERRFPNGLMLRAVKSALGEAP